MFIYIYICIYELYVYICIYLCMHVYTPVVYMICAYNLVASISSVTWGGVHSPVLTAEDSGSYHVDLWKLNIP